VIRLNFNQFTLPEVFNQVENFLQNPMSAEVCYCIFSFRFQVSNIVHVILLIFCWMTVAREIFTFHQTQHEVFQCKKCLKTQGNCKNPYSTALRKQSLQPCGRHLTKKLWVLSACYRLFPHRSVARKRKHPIYLSKR
jgi:hypothetical protein